MAETEKFIEGEEEIPTSQKLPMFAKELTNWLTLISIAFFVIYGILALIYEIALDLTNVRWAFIGFLVWCLIDIAAYWICRFAVQDHYMEGKYLLYFVLLLQVLACLYYLIAPIIVLCTYRLSPEVSSSKKTEGVEEISKREKSSEYEEQFYHTFEEYVNPDPCLEGANSKSDLWQCSYVNSIKVSAWCMMILLIPKAFLIFILFRILKKPNEA